MTTLVHAALAFRRTARASFGYAAALLFGLLDLLGVFFVRPAELGAPHAAVALAWLGVFGARVQGRLRETPRGAQSWLDLELGLLLLVAFHGLLQVFGGLSSPAYPMVYVLIAFITSFAERHVGRALVGAAILFEAALYFLTESQADLHTFALHALFLMLFGVLSLMFTQAELARMRRASRQELDEQKARTAQDARMFRLVGTSTEDAPRDDERLLRSSVDEVHHSLYYVLELLHRTLRLHTCALLFQDDAGEALRIVEMVTDSDDIAESPFPLGSGAVGAAATRGLVTHLEHIRPGYKGICYYRGPATVRTFLALPVQEGGQIRGALCADRLDDRPFDDAEQQVLRDAIDQMLRALENERIFLQLERSKREQTILHRASQALGSALSESAVLEAGLAAAEQIAAFDFAAVTHYDPKTRKHSVRRAVGDKAADFENLSFRDNTSLTAMAVKNRHYLPYRGDYDSRQQTVYTRKANLQGMQSLLILPLIVREEAIGTLALAARRPDAFGNELRPALQVLANQLAVALSNAASVRRLEEMAITDGLTGCYNKRAFTDELDKRLRAAHRFGRALSLVITDIDHFKSVNDTYGHATGDVVIKELGDILKRLKRETDVVARFGGEEFCVLCEETDTHGAVQLAERVREELENTIFQTDIGKLRVTCSLGVATYPNDARDQRLLFEVADRALYAAKHGGRNQVRGVRG